MPYPNEHAARFKEPGQYIRIRRENDKFGAGIDAIWGIKKSGGEEVTELQSIRFSKSKFTAAQARAWLKEHDMTPIKFEAAKETTSDDIMDALGEGRGVGGPRQGIGGADKCVCPECGFTKAHDRGTPCAEMKCPKCGATMSGAATKTKSDSSTVMRFDRGSIGEPIVTEEGYIRATPIVTRTGVFLYLNEDGTERRELRHPDDVFNFDSLSSMKMIPITNGHPRERMVNADSAKRLTVGHTGESIVPDGKYVRSSIVVTDGKAVEAVRNGRNQLSLGYQVELIEEDGFFGGEQYDHRQTNIRYNHLALVDSARAGNAASLHIDSAEIDPIPKQPKNQTQTQTQTQGGTMPTMVKVTLDGIEYDAQPEVKNALTKALQSNQDNAAAVEKITKERDTVTAERDDLKAKLDEATKKLENNDHIQEAVKTRLALVETAKKVLDAADHEKIDGMTDAEIKNSVILKRHPDAKLDGQSDAYIQARFDAVVEDVKKDGDKDNKGGGAADQKKQIGAGGNTDNNDELDAEKARERMIKRNNDAWKGEKKDQ